MSPEELEQLKHELLAAAESVRSSLITAALLVAGFVMLSHYAKRH